MTLTQSTMMDLGSPAPGFELPSTDGGRVSLSDCRDAQALVVLFICNHCPYVIHIALDLILAGEKVPEQQYPSMGCNIKWKPVALP